jgi:hypothetical protein
VSEEGGNHWKRAEPIGNNRVPRRVNFRCKSRVSFKRKSTPQGF